jgi:dipeptidase D
MKTDLEKLKPAEVWSIFGQILQIPRPSSHEEKIREFVAGFGKNLGLETITDEAGNVIIRKPATPGMENRKGVVLQGHLDMVPQKNSDKVHDFENDPIEYITEGDWVRANETTLGADNGIGVSAMLAVLASKELSHGPLEALFTATEETGMDGANGLQPGILHGEILINTDSEDEGELYVGCAGGEDLVATFKYKAKKPTPKSVGLKLSVTGLKGGHSGIDIPLGRGNAIQIFFRILKKINAEFGARLAEIEGGSLRNAIPREAFGILSVKKSQVAKVTGLIEELSEVIKDELSVTEPDLKIQVEKVKAPRKVINKSLQCKLTRAIIGCPNGVIRMSDAMPGLVETSSNLAVVKSDPKKETVFVACLMRSSVDSAKAFLGTMISSVFSLAGAKVRISGGYPGWKPDPNSAILKTMQQVYHTMFGKIPEIRAIHAGLECGILAGKYPEWDLISFGPTIRYPHSPDEKVFIPSVQKFWDFLTETLKNIPEK